MVINYFKNILARIKQNEKIRIKKILQNKISINFIPFGSHNHFLRIKN